MTAIAALGVGVAVGLLAVVASWRRLVEARAGRQLERWQAEGGRGAVRRAVDARRAGIKAELGTQLAPRLPAFPFEPADTRFLGSPAHFVVFAGHTAVKDGRRGDLAEVVFASLGGEGPAGDDARLLDECLRAGRTRWVTLRVDAGLPNIEPPAP